MSSIVVSFGAVSHKNEQKGAFRSGMERFEEVLRKVLEAFRKKLQKLRGWKRCEAQLLTNFDMFATWPDPFPVVQQKYSADPCHIHTPRFGVSHTHTPVT